MLVIVTCTLESFDKPFFSCYFADVIERIFKSISLFLGSWVAKGREL